MSRVINARNQRILVSELERASTLKSRLMGLIGRTSLPSGHGLLIERSGNSIHTFFMRFPIDLLFMTKKGEIKYAAKNIGPWKLVIAPLLSSTDCLELPAGTLEQTDTRVGDQIRVEA